MSIAAAIAVPHPPLIVPDVGRGDERRIQATIDAYNTAARALLEREPDVLVVTSPHAPLFRDVFHITTDAALDGTMARFRAPRARIHAECDTELAREILSRAAQADIPCIGSDQYRDDMDHGTYVPLHFLREAFRAMQPARAASRDLPCPIVRIGLSCLSPQMHRQLGRAIVEAGEALGRRIGFVASGDLSHKLLAEGPYGFAPEGPEFDERIGQIFAAGNLDALFEFDEEFCDAAAECGLRSFQIMTGALDGLACDIRLLSNEGPFGVGYGVATCLPQTQAGAEVADATGAAGDAESADPHVELARLSVETFVHEGRPAQLPNSVSAELLSRRAGVFVSLHEHGELRGCIGTIAATTPSIAEEILRNGICACSEDPRFPPVRADELDFLEYSVDVLGEAEPISSPDQLDPRRYGVIVTKGWKRGLLLPNLDGVDTVDVQLAIAKRKAGIAADDPDVQLERFEVVRHTRGGQPRRS